MGLMQRNKGKKFERKIAGDIRKPDREERCGVCGVCGDRSAHFRACADCDYSIGRCAHHGDRKSVSREMVLHRQREHGAQIQIAGTESAVDPVLEIQRPRTREECRDGPRPCPWVGCRHHLLLEIAYAKPRADDRGRKRDARPTTIRLNRAPKPGTLGRRPGLNAGDATEIVQRWIDDAVEHLDTMGDTCALDVAERGGASLVDVARLLGVTTASIKEEVGPAGIKLRAGLKEYEDHEPIDHSSALARLGGA